MAKVYLRAGVWFAGNKQLSDSQTTVLLAIMGRPFVAVNELIEMCYPDPDHEPECAKACIRLFCWGLRKKLAPLGWTVETRLSQVRLVPITA